MTQPLAVLILAAGKGTRMKSDLAKVLHPLLGQPLLAHVLNSARYLHPERTVVVVGHQADRVRQAFPEEGLTFVHQTEQLGTGHAVLSAREALADFQGTVLILSGDVPLLSPQTMIDFLDAYRESRTTLAVLTVELDCPGMYGRVILDEDGYLARIVEARDACPEELAVREINTGIYAVEARFLFEAVAALDANNDQQEYYLTDLVAAARSKGLLAAAVMSPDPNEVMGINDRAELAEASSRLQARINLAWMRAGVTMIDPSTTYIEALVRLEPDVTLWPGCQLLGRTTVGSGAAIGPDCLLENADIGAGATIDKGSVIRNASVAAGEALPPLTVRIVS